MNGKDKKNNNSIWQKIKATMFSANHSIKHQIFNISMFGGVIVGIISVLNTAIVSEHPLGALAMLVTVVFLIGMALYANLADKFEIASVISCILLNSVLFPLIYFYGGGIHSGMGLWFCLGIVFEFMLLEGGWFLISFSFNLIAIVACMAVSYCNPELVRPIGSELGIYLDVLQSLVLCATALGLLVKYQLKFYIQKNDQLKIRQRQLENQAKELEDAVKSAEAANVAKRNFLANMSHEIRTPMNVVVGMNEMILRETNEESTREYAQKIEVSSNLLLSIIRDILDFSKIESGSMELLPVKYHSAILIDGIVTAIETRMKEKELVLKVEADSKIPRAMVGDEVRIKQIILNLLTNAVKYTQKGTVTLKIGGHFVENGQFILQVSVKDTGIGIKEEDMKNLMVAFRRLEETRNRNIEGTGLGLNITNSFLKLMGSRLEVSSVYGRGSEFSFELLQQVADQMPMGDFRQNPSRGAAQKKKRSFTAPDAEILVVDDNKMNLDVIRALLKKNEVKVTLVDSGAKCLEIVQQKKFHIIFLDHMMPEMDGLETLARLRKLGIDVFQDTIVIALTANAVVGAREEYIKAGFSDYLSKPVRGEKLESIVRKYLPQSLIQHVEDSFEDEE